MPNISCPILVGHLRFTFPAELFHDNASEGTDGRAPSSSDIKHLVIGRFTGHGKKIRLHDIADVHIVTALQSILMDNRRLPIEESGGEYRQDALDIAKAELKWRRVEIPKPEEPEEISNPVSGDPLLGRIGSAREELPESVCLICGGRLRAGSLVAEKELTIVFSDNHEERFIRVNACTQCGQLSLVVDFATDVQQ